MGRKTKIAIVTGVVVVCSGARSAYAYDSSQKDKIAEGVTIGGVDVGGMDAEEAEAGRPRPAARARSATRSGSATTARAGSSPARALKVHADVDAAVEEALDESRDGGLPGRMVRYVTGGDVDERIPADVTYSQPAVNRFVRMVAEEINREPEDATVEPSGGDRSSWSRRRTGASCATTCSPTRSTPPCSTPTPTTRSPPAPTRAKPEVTGSEVADEYPTYLTLDRGSYTLRLWEDLKLAKTYTVAVGQEGLETPEGLYAIQEKAENPTWNVPESDWAGWLAGQSIPPGPSNPIKARWMGIYEGAGIHGTEETYSLGTAASHGCVRMSIPDVEELYDRVEVGTPIYIG